MEDIRKIRRRLWQSLDMLCIKKYLILIAVCAVLGPLIVFIKSDLPTMTTVSIGLLSVSLVIAPFLIFCICQTVRIFRRARNYRFYKTTLINPKAGDYWDTIKFGMVLELAEGKTVVVSTRSIFSTHSGNFRVPFEYYVNRNVTVAYNEETGNVVVIG